jgi:hypothetical protein
MALSGHSKHGGECLLLGVKRTCLFALPMSACDIGHVLCFDQNRAVTPKIGPCIVMSNS